MANFQEPDKNAPTELTLQSNSTVAPDTFYPGDRVKLPTETTGIIHSVSDNYAVIYYDDGSGRQTFSDTRRLTRIPEYWESM